MSKQCGQYNKRSCKYVLLLRHACKSLTVPKFGQELMIFKNNLLMSAVIKIKIKKKFVQNIKENEK